MGTGKAKRAGGAQLLEENGNTNSVCELRSCAGAAKQKSSKPRKDTREGEMRRGGKDGLVL